MYICRSCLARGKRVFLFISLSTSSIYDFSEIFVLLVPARASNFRLQCSKAQTRSSPIFMCLVDLVAHSSIVDTATNGPFQWFKISASPLVYVFLHALA